MKEIKIFFTEFKTIRYAEITPQKITGNNKYDESFFKQLDIIENNVLDGQSFEETVNNDNLEVVSIKKIDANKKDPNRNEIKNLSDKLFNKIYNIKFTKSPEIVSIENKYFLVEIMDIEKKNQPLENPDVQKALDTQLSFKKK